MARTIQVIKKRSKKFGRRADKISVQKTIWTIGHLTCLICGILFSLTYFFHVLLFFKYRNWKWLFLRPNHNFSVIRGTRWYHCILRHLPNILFRTSLIGVFTASGVTMTQNWTGLKPTWFDLLSSANFQSTLIALLWFFGGGKSFYRILPFMIISFIHLSNRKLEFAKEDKKSVDEMTLGNKKILHVLAYTEILVAVALLLDTLLMKTGTAGFMFIIYMCFFWLRLNFAPYLQVTILRLLDKFDHKVPPKYRSTWETVRKFIFAKIRQREERRKESDKRA